MKVLSTIQVIIILTFFMGSVFRVIEDADILKPPVKYFFISPLIFFVIFAICFGTLLLTRYLEKTKKVNNYIRTYANTWVASSLAGIAISNKTNIRGKTCLSHHH